MTIEQKVVTVSNTDLAINAEITTQASDAWFIYLIALFNDDSKAVLLFQRTTAGV